MSPKQRLAVRQINSAPLLSDLRNWFETASLPGSVVRAEIWLCQRTTGKLPDIPAQQLSVGGLPLLPADTEIRRVDIIVAMRPGAK